MSEGSSDYRVSQALTVRFMGALLVLLGVLVLVTAALVGLLGWPSRVLSVVVVIAVAGVLVGGYVISRLSVVRVDATGFQVRYIRGAGVKQGRWLDVQDVVTAYVANDPVVVLRHRDGRSTTIPVRLLARDRDDFVRDLQQRLQEGHGYRRLA